MNPARRPRRRLPQSATTTPAAGAVVMAAILGPGFPTDAQPVVPTPQALEEPPARDPSLPPRPTLLGPSEDGPDFLVDRIVLEYGEGYPRVIPSEELLRVEADLQEAGAAYSVARDGVARLRVPMARLAESSAPGEPGRRLTAGAINELCRALVAEFNRRGFIGVVVIPDPAQIDPRSLEDLRDTGSDASLRLLVLPGWVGRVEVLKMHDGMPRESPRHSWIIGRSPLQGPPANGGPGDALNRDQLEQYLRRLRRHPGRRVEATFSPDGEAGEVALEYLVTESKPWTLFAQVANTGTRQTGEWRQRFGLVHNQLTGRDDILAIDYVTAGFADTHAVLASYAAPLASSDRVRWRLFGHWQQYEASDVGITSATFEGDSWAAGGEILANFFQHQDVFVDLIGGVRFERVHVDNSLAATDGRTAFLFPYLGVDFERLRPASSTQASLRLEWTLADAAGTDSTELDELGRTGIDRDWIVVRYDASHSFFLEPIMAGEEATTLAHEIAVGLRGQYAFDFRLTPQAQQVIGGAYTVRGYPEALTAADSTIVASLEYRVHVPRLLSIEPDPSATPLLGRPFRLAPDRPQGYADWDLVLKGFVDAGKAFNSERLSFERNDGLVGAGLGIELVVLRNLSVRADWGVALQEVPGRVSAGSSRVHLVATILY